MINTSALVVNEGAFVSDSLVTGLQCMLLTPKQYHVIRGLSPQHLRSLAPEVSGVWTGLLTPERALSLLLMDVKSLLVFL